MTQEKPKEPPPLSANWLRRWREWRERRRTPSLIALHVVEYNKPFEDWRRG